MPPKKNANKVSEPVTSTTKVPPRTRQRKNNNLSEKKEIPNHSNVPYKSSIEKSPNKRVQEDSLLSKRDINIMLANEVVKKQFPSKIPILDAIEHAIIDEIEVPKNIFKKTKKVPLKQKLTDKKNVHNVRKKRKLETVSSSNQETSFNTTEQENINNHTSENASMKKKPLTKLALKKRQAQKNKTVENKLTKPKINKKSVPIRNEIKVCQRGRKKKNIEQKFNIEEQKDVLIKETEQPVDNIIKSTLKKKKNIVQNLSRSSSCSDLSWTRDISSCSTSLSASSKDFVLIDNKLPIVRLKSINLTPPKSGVNTIKGRTQRLNKSNENKSIDKELLGVKGEEKSFLEKKIGSPDSALVPPVLSSSSSSCNSCTSTSLSKNNSCVRNNNIEDLVNVATKLRNLDLEVITWFDLSINNNNNSTLKLVHFKQKLEKSKALQEEKNLLQNVYKFKEIYTPKKVIDEEIKINNQEEITFAKPNSVSHTNFKNRVSEVENTLAKPSQSVDNSVANNNTSKYQDENDDDDALSLYAESITGLDSSRRSSSIQHFTDLRRNEEYKPEFVKKTSKVPVTFYQPTRIEITHETDQEVDKPVCQKNVVSAVCEKQNADSTSLNKEHENEKKTTEDVIMYEDRQGNIEKSNINANLYNASKPSYINNLRFIAQNFKPFRSRSTVFNVCYSNLGSRCLNVNCKFNHIIPSREEIENKVASLDEDTFVHEYMLMRSIHPLRRKFGICFVNDCIRRRLTRLLVEMVIDFTSKGDYNNPDSKSLTADVVERTLLYLNNVDLNVCADFLRSKIIRLNGILLCDFLLQFIAESPNFTRFIPIFIKLAWYISGMEFRFNTEVSKLLLERVCILPYEDKLARALIEVIKNTNDTIFHNHMIEKFEKMLMFANKGLSESFAFLKKRKLLNQSVEESWNGGRIENDIRYSPDTTNLDNMNKPMEPKLIRTIENPFPNESSSKNQVSEDWNLPSSSRCTEQSVYALNSQCKIPPLFQNGPKLQSRYKRHLDTSFADNYPNKIRRTVQANFQRGYSSMPSNSSSGSEDRGQTHNGMRSQGSTYPRRGATRGMHKRQMCNNRQFANSRNSDGPRFF